MGRPAACQRVNRSSEARHAAGDGGVHRSSMQFAAGVVTIHSPLDRSRCAVRELTIAVHLNWHRAMQPRLESEMTKRTATGWFRASLGWFLVPLALTSLNAHDAEARTARRLVSAEDARLLGLERAWHAQVQLDRARNHVERAVLTGDRLTVLTSSGVVQ